MELRVEGFPFAYDIGNPKLPVQMKLIEIPVNAVPRVEIIDYEMHEYNLSDFGLMYPVIPAQPPYPKSDDTPPPFELSVLGTTSLPVNGSISIVTGEPVE